MRAQIASFFRRNSVTMALAVIILAFTLMLFLQSLAIARLQEQVSGQQQIVKQVQAVADSLNAVSGQRTKQIDRLTRHIDCIVIYFNQAHVQKTLTTIDQCTDVNPYTGAIE